MSEVNDALLQMRMAFGDVAVIAAFLETMGVTQEVYTPTSDLEHGAQGTVYERLADAMSDVVREREGDDAVVINWIAPYEFMRLSDTTEPGYTVPTGLNYVSLPTGNGPGALGLLSITETKIHDQLAYNDDEEDD